MFDLFNTFNGPSFQQRDRMKAEHFIGDPGTAGFGNAAVYGPLPPGFYSLVGSDTPTSEYYGNYIFEDGSYCVYRPLGYYRWGHPDNPTYPTFGANSLDIKGADTFANEAEANAAGYALHRKFKDGGRILRGVFDHKYDGSPNAAGNGIISVPNGVPVSLTNDANYTNSFDLGGGGYLYDAVDMGRAIGDEWACMALWDFSWSAMISIAHGQAATSTAHCAWFDPTYTTNFPKGCNNNALGDINDGSILYVTAGDPGSANKPLTGSANDPAKVADNGQLCGVMDLNGSMWKAALGVTSTTDASGDAYVLKESVALADLTSGYNTGDTGSMDAWGDAAHLATLYDEKTAFFPWGAATGWYQFGNGSAQVFSEAISADDYLRTCCGIGIETGMGPGSHLFGNDGCYRYNRDQLFPLVAGLWDSGANCGVLARAWNYGRTNRGNVVSFRGRRAFA